MAWKEGKMAPGAQPSTSLIFEPVRRVKGRPELGAIVGHVNARLSKQTF